MPIDEGVNVDLQFLILEVKKQARASLSVIERPTPSKIDKILIREDYVDNLKNTLENKSYFSIHRRVESDRQLNYFKALITIAANLERVADFFAHIAEQMQHVEKPESFAPFELKRYYQVIFKALDATYPALNEHDLNLAQKICDYEQQLDDLFEESFAKVRSNLRQRRNVDDMLTLLNVVRYLERVGDSFLNIGEAILDIRVGEKMGIKQFRNLRIGLESQSIDIGDDDVVFRPIMNTRSGSRLARIHTQGEPGSVFYKEGEKEKINQEIDGLKMWNSRFPGIVPHVLWHSSRSKHATLLLEYLEGSDLLEVVLNKGTKLDTALNLLTTSLVEVWDKTRRRKSAKVDYISQLQRRRDDIQSVHSDLFDLYDGMDELMSQARKVERELKAPFTTLIHGDFNADNIIFQFQNSRMFFVDVHRTTFGDYTQDISVFLVSNFRVPIFSNDIRQRLNEANRRIFECARSYAAKNEDSTFEARLALGLFRSLITSTRFLFNESFSSDMFHRAINIMHELLQSQDNLKKFSLREEHFLYG